MLSRVGPYGREVTLNFHLPAAWLKGFAFSLSYILRSFCIGGIPLFSRIFASLAGFTLRDSDRRSKSQDRPPTTLPYGRDEFRGCFALSLQSYGNFVTKTGAWVPLSLYRETERMRNCFTRMILIVLAHACAPAVPAQSCEGSWSGQTITEGVTWLSAIFTNCFGWSERRFLLLYGRQTIRAKQYLRYRMFRRLSERTQLTADR